jgi:diketogulonate reductase-like aldo/keto reductase
LKRLATDRLDLFLLHWPGALPIGETFRAMESLIAEKQIRFMGVSNFDLGDLRGALKAVRNERLACNQVLYHLRDRGIERRIVPFCAERGIAVMGYSPFGHGDFPGAESPAGRVLAEVAARHHATARQVALAFLIRDGISAIPKSRDSSRMRENAAAAELILSPSDFEAIDRAFPPSPSDTPIGVI